MKKQLAVISISHPLESWFGQTYSSKEIIYGERSAFFLPKASPLTVNAPIVFRRETSMYMKQIISLGAN